VSRDWFASIKGNHEIFLECWEDPVAWTSWIANGGDWVNHIPLSTLLQCAKLTRSLPVAITVGEGPDRFNICHAQPHHQHGRITDAIISSTPAQPHTSHVFWERDIFLYPDTFDLTGDLSTTYMGHNMTTHLVRAGPLYFLDRGASLSVKRPEMCMAIACHTTRTVYEYYQHTGILNITALKDIPDMSHPDYFEPYYVL
jgi:serine/threonine protein phosphatase 1